MTPFNPANFAPYAQTARQEERPQAATVETTVTAVALREAGNRWLKRHDQFADGKADTCFDMADKLDRFGSFVSEKQAGYAAKLIAWSLPKPYSAVIEATVRPPVAAPQQARTSEAAELVRANPTLPKLFDLMQRLSKFRIGKLTIARKNGDSLCWIKHEDAEKVIGRLTDGGTLTLWQRLGVDLQDVSRALLEIEADPERAAVLHGKASGNCSICGRDLTDPESIERGIGPICAGKYF
jgi:hypothetical protein